MKKRQRIFKILIGTLVGITLLLSLSLAISASEDGAVGESYAAEENIFTEIYTAITENSADILSLLSFVASLSAALFYKYALSPLIKGGLERISSGVKDISGEKSKEYLALIECQKRLDEREGEIEERLDEIKTELSSICDSEKPALEKRLITVMQAQVNMLYEIFQSSALPVYQKEAVGNMINEMRCELSKNEKCDE